MKLSTVHQTPQRGSAHSQPFFIIELPAKLGMSLPLTQGNRINEHLQMELAVPIGLQANGGLSSWRDGVKIAPGNRSAARGKRVG